MSFSGKTVHLRKGNSRIHSLLLSPEHLEPVEGTRRLVENLKYSPYLLRPCEGRGFSGVARRCLTNIRYLCGTSVTLCHVTDLIDLRFQAERAVSPLDGAELWVVLDPGSSSTGRPAISCGRCTGPAVRLTDRAEPLGGLAGFLGWCAGQGVDWSSVSLAALARFKHFIEVTPGRGGRLRVRGATVNATLTGVCEFLRFCALDRADRDDGGRAAVGAAVAAVHPAGVRCRGVRPVPFTGAAARRRGCRHRSRKR